MSTTLRPPSHFFFPRLRQPPPSPLFPYTTLFRSLLARVRDLHRARRRGAVLRHARLDALAGVVRRDERAEERHRSEEHTSELQSHHDLVCRLLLEKKKKNNTENKDYTTVTQRCRD